MKPWGSDNHLPCTLMYCRVQTETATTIVLVEIILKSKIPAIVTIKSLSSIYIPYNLICLQ